MDARNNAETASKSETSVVVEEITPPPGGEASSKERPRKGARFWLIIVSILLCLFLSAIELSAVSTALPTIAHDLNGDDFVWIGSAYALASTALLPATGGMAEVFGRRETMLAAQALFALGSALCGSAKSMNWLIAGRTIQGAGGGGLQAITQIIVSDLVPLNERPLFNGLIGIVSCISSAMGPVVGGALAQDGQWRWLFYLNLPLTGLAAILVLLFLKLKTPQGSFREKFGRMDWIGNFLIISSSSAVVIALTWGGVKFSWTSANVLVPLIVGLVGVVVFFAYEATLAKEPLVPFVLIANRTSLSGYIQNFVGPTIMLGAIYFLPVYYQACKNASPVRSGVETFGLAMVFGPVILVCSASIAITKTYRAQLWFGWAITLVAMGIMSTLKADSPLSQAIGYPVLLGIGGGIWYGATYYPVLAPLPTSEIAHALAFFAFGRQFAAVWGVTIGTAVLQTQLKKRLPQAFLSEVAGNEGVALAYSLIPVIPTLDEPVFIGLSGVGMITSLFMRGLPLHTETDKRWGLQEATDQEVREEK